MAGLFIVLFTAHLPTPKPHFPFSTHYSPFTFFGITAFGTFFSSGFKKDFTGLGLLGRLILVSAGLVIFFFSAVSESICIVFFFIIFWVIVLVSFSICFACCSSLSTFNLSCAKSIFELLLSFTPITCPAYSASIILYLSNPVLPSTSS